jgi:hypothetical protein
LGHVVCLQHPHELKKALATIPLLKHTLLHSSVIVGRSLAAAATPHVAALLDATQAAAPTTAAWKFQKKEANTPEPCSPAPNEHTGSAARLSPPVPAPHPPPPLYVLFPGKGVCKLTSSPACFQIL